MLPKIFSLKIEKANRYYVLLKGTDTRHVADGGIAVLKAVQILEMSGRICNERNRRRETDVTRMKRTVRGSFVSTLALRMSSKSLSTHFRCVHER